MFYLQAFLTVVLLAVAATLFYRTVNKGLSSSARHQQLTRLSTAALLAMAPTLATATVPPAATLAVAAATSVAWAVTYPLIYHLANHRVSPDYDNYGDIAAGLYLYALLSATAIAASATAITAVAAVAAVVISAVETCAIAIIASLIIYYALYRRCIDANAMEIVQQTNYNEIIEFSRSYPPVVTWASAGAILLAATGLTWANVHSLVNTPVAQSWWRAAVAAVMAAVAARILFGGRRPAFSRSGLPALYITVKEYRDGCMRYASSMAGRVAALEVTPRGKAPSRPTSMLLIIGESASRDWMSAFTPLDRDTTPWLRTLAADDRTVLFPNAYASAMHTVAVLQKALTEASQYNDKTFADSCSIIDIARKAGYKIHWYSNQGHLGSADTPVTLVADTADDAAWTRQRLNTVQYDMSLLDFLDRIDPACNNFIVLHLKGSHFNFLNRYPAEATVWGTPGVQDNEVNYMNSIRYTDTFMHRAFDICRSRFNIQSMVYFSDHATIPSRRRSAGFDGWGHVRIPLAVWLGDEYVAAHPGIYENLLANRTRYWTNDLAYELIVGLMDVDTNRYDPTASLTSPSYRFTRDMLMTFDGTIRLADEQSSTENTPKASRQ